MGPELVIAGWFASVIIKNLADMVFSYAQDQKDWQWGMKDELKRLVKALPQIQSVLDAVENGHVKDPNPKLQEWIWQFRGAVDDAEDVLDELEYHQLEDEVKAGTKNKVRIAASRFKEIMIRAIQRDPTLKRLRESVKKLDEVAAHVGGFLELVRDQAASRKQRHREFMETRETAPFVSTDNGAVIGRDKERDDIVRKLLECSPATCSSSNKPNILPIVGMGGIGKTTLAQYVFNDPRIGKHFKLRLWVCVSDVFEPKILTQKILEEATGNTPNLNSLASLQKELIRVLKSKMYLLVLDDVWNDKDRAGWEKLFAGLRSGQSGSKVLITTRSEKITDMMTCMMPSFRLEGLQDNDLLTLFMNCSFGDEDPRDHERLQHIGIKIAKKLKRSPLAAKAVGGLLRGRLDDVYWASIVHDINSCFKEGGNDVRPILHLSYMQLPPYLKGCFAFCSIFPQDHSFSKNDLVYMWMAVGLVQQSENESPEDTGRRYLDELSKRCLFDVHKDDNGDIDYYTMHDLLHDLAQSVSEGECLRIVDSKPVRVPTSIRHLYVSTNSVALIKKISELMYLRTLILSFSFSETEYLHTWKKYTFKEELRKLEDLKKLTRLRVLHLSSDPIVSFDSFPNFLGDLIHLRYFNFQAIEVESLPKSLAKLYHLQVLMPCYKSTGDEVMGSLINLRHLVSHYNREIWSISGIGKLTSLQNLDFYVGKGNCNKLKELGDMKELRELNILELDNIELAEEASAAKLKEKEHLRTLSLRGLSGHVRHFREHVLDQLEPHPNLKELTICEYVGFRSPLWIEDQRLTNLQCIDLSSCDKWDPLPLLAPLPYLKTLRLDCMNAVIVIGVGSHEDGIMFRQLQSLQTYNMGALIGLYGEGIPIHEWFPSLRTLTMLNCHKLMGLPQQLCHSTTLLELRICSCSRLEHNRVVGPEGFRGLSSLRVLQLAGCPHLLGSGIPLPSSLEKLTIYDCGLDDESLSTCLGGGLTSLAELHIQGGDLSFEVGRKLTSFPSEAVMQQLTSLQKLFIKNFSTLTGLGGLHALPSLLSLDISGLSSLSSLPPLPGSMSELSVDCCHRGLVERCKEDGGADWPNIGHIPYRTIRQYDSLFEGISSVNNCWNRWRDILLKSSSDLVMLDCKSSIGYTLWLRWKDRNRWFFDGAGPLPPQDLARSALWSAKEWRAIFELDSRNIEDFCLVEAAGRITLVVWRHI